MDGRAFSSGGQKVCMCVVCVCMCVCVGGAFTPFATPQLRHCFWCRDFRIKFTALEVTCLAEGKVLVELK